MLQSSLLRRGVSTRCQGAARLVVARTAETTTTSLRIQQQRNGAAAMAMTRTARLLFSTQPQPQSNSNISAFAAVDHSVAYETAMQGQHGRQLALADAEGFGKDDPDFDPFLEEEMEEDRLRAAAAERGTGVSDNNNNDSDDDDDDGIQGDHETTTDSDDEEDDDSMTSSIYNNDGSLKRTKSELASFRAGKPAGGIMAIIELAGTQHKVTTDDVLIVNRLKPVQKYTVGSVHTLSGDDNGGVLLVSSSHLTLVGMPYVTGAEVDVMVEEVTKDAKVIIFKKRRRKNSQRRNGFRRDITMLRILDIRPPAKYRGHEHVERPMPSSQLLLAEEEEESA